MHHLPGVVPLYTAVEMRTVDRVTVDEIGVPGAVLMERAGMGARGGGSAANPCTASCNSRRTSATMRSPWLSTVSTTKRRSSRP